MLADFFFLFSAKNWVNRLRHNYGAIMLQYHDRSVSVALSLFIVDDAAYAMVTIGRAITNALKRAWYMTNEVLRQRIRKPQVTTNNQLQQ